MRQNIDTILFDLDGTLVDTIDLILESFVHTFNRFVPNHFTREDCIQFIGPTLKETFESVLPEKADDMLEFYRDFNKKNHDILIKQYDGVYETLKTLSEKNYKIAVVTTKMKDTAVKGLKAANLEGFIQYVVALDDIKKAKPDPEPILKALELLDSTPETTIMVGDSHHDILGAKNAGTQSVAVGWSIKGKDYLASYEPDFIIDDMKELLKIVGAE